MNARAWFYSTSFHANAREAGPFPLPAPKPARVLPKLAIGTLTMLKLEAAGPFSFRDEDGELRTYAKRSIFCSTTYQTMLSHGWGQEVV